MEAIDIEFEHTNEETPSYADRCGCPKCERYRATPPPDADKLARIDAQLDRAARRSAEIVAAVESTAPAETSLADALSATSQQSIADANALDLGTVANGRATLGVGFSDASGYIESLRRGVAPVTLREYVGILKRQYKRDIKSVTSSDGASYTVTMDGETFTAQMLIMGPRSNEPSVDTGASDEAIRLMKERTAKRKAHAAKVKEQAKSEQPQGSLVVVPDEEQRAAKLVHGKLVAGAAAEGHGILVGWTGAGDMTREQKQQRVDLAGVPRAWMWDPKDPGVQLTRAVKAAAGADYNCEQEKKNKQQTVEAREWASRWMLVSGGVGGAAVEGSRVGQKFGEIALCVTLYTDKPTPELVFDEGADATLVERVRQEFDLRIGEQRYTASDITRWLKEVLRGQLEAARYGGNLYVPKKHRATAERLVDAFKNWGSDWMDPPLPIADSDQLARGLANGFKRDVDDVLSKLEAQRKERRKTDPDAEIGEDAAQGFITRFRNVLESCARYAELLGDECISDVRSRVQTAMHELSAALDEDTLAINQRFQNLWDEVKRDINKDEGAGQ